VYDTAPLTDEELAKRVEEFVIESTEKVGVETANEEQEFNDMMMSQEYLREEREQEQWDCETILTTYSTLDNHPSVIQKERRHKKKAQSVDGSTTSNSRDNLDGKFYSRGSLKAPTQPQPIVLGGKYMLPKESNPRLKNKKKTKLAPIDSESEESSDSESSEGEEEVAIDETADGTEVVKLKREKPKSLRQKETPEEKKLRKQQVIVSHNVHSSSNDWK
jgi:protein LTV1